MSSLDELPEFSQRVLEALRQPFEDARVVVSRAAGTASFPARFQLVAAANPCRRGCASLSSCACSPPERVRYLGRLSRPLLDRIDLHLEIPARRTPSSPPAPWASSALKHVRYPILAPIRCHFDVRLWGIPGGFEVSRPS